jgi:activator of HSP90 ATPase
MVLHNPGNWHWVSKDTSAWTREYLDKELIGTSAEDNGVTAQVDKILSMDGDVDVSQRKGKVITLFDVKLQLEYSGMFLVDSHSRIRNSFIIAQARQKMTRA